MLSLFFPYDVQENQYLETRRWGVTYLANPANYIDWNILCLGSYERDDLELFRRFGKKSGGVCLDVGANVGHHAIFFGSLGWTVHAFEPNPQLWSEFDAKVQASGLEGVVLHRIGLGAEDSSLEFELENATNSGTGRFFDGNATSPETAANVGLLPIRNGDRYLRETGIEHVDVIKMDIQGFEPEALAGLRQTIFRDRPLVSIEIASDNREKFGSFDRLRTFLPEDYFFVRTRVRNFGPIRRTVVEVYDGENFSTINGNLFCVSGFHW